MNLAVDPGQHHPLDAVSCAYGIREGVGHACLNARYYNRGCA